MMVFVLFVPDLLAVHCLHYVCVSFALALLAIRVPFVHVSLVVQITYIRTVVQFVLFKV